MSPTNYSHVREFGLRLRRFIYGPVLLLPPNLPLPTQTQPISFSSKKMDRANKRETERYRDTETREGGREGGVRGVERGVKKVNLSSFNFLTFHMKRDTVFTKHIYLSHHVYDH